MGGQPYKFAKRAPSQCFLSVSTFIHKYISILSTSPLPSPIFSTRNSDFRYLVFWGMCTYVYSIWGSNLMSQ